MMVRCVQGPMFPAPVRILLPTMALLLPGLVDGNGFTVARNYHRTLRRAGGFLKEGSEEGVHGAEEEMDVPEAPRRPMMMGHHQPATRGQRPALTSIFAVDHNAGRPGEEGWWRDGGRRREEEWRRDDKGSGGGHGRRDVERDDS